MYVFYIILSHSTYICVYAYFNLSEYILSIFLNHYNIYMYIYFFLHIFSKACQDDLEESAEMELSETNSWNSVSNGSDSQVKINTWQTDESKAAEQQTSFRLQQPKTSKSYVPCLADTGNYLSYVYVCIKYHFA